MKLDNPFDKEVLQERLYLLQNKAHESGISFYVIIEGWAQSGKGRILKTATYRMDPKKLKVYSPLDTDAWDTLYPFQFKYWYHFPPKGTMMFLLKSWYNRASFAVWRKDVPKDKIDSVIRSIFHLEKTVSDDGVHILKFFLDLEKDELEKRIKRAEKEKLTWEVTLEDKAQVKDYDKFAEYFENYRTITDQGYAPWIRISANDPDKMEMRFLKELVSAMEKRLSLDSWEMMKSLNIEED